MSILDYIGFLLGQFGGTQTDSIGFGVVLINCTILFHHNSTMLLLICQRHSCPFLQEILRDAQGVGGYVVSASFYPRSEVGLFDLTNSAMVECLDSLNRITCQASPCAGCTKPKPKRAGGFEKGRHKEDERQRQHVHLSQLLSPAL